MNITLAQNVALLIEKKTQIANQLNIVYDLVRHCHDENGSYISFHFQNGNSFYLNARYYNVSALIPFLESTQRTIVADMEKVNQEIINL